MALNIPENFTLTGWRRTGFINVLLVLGCGVALLICLIMSLKTGSSLYETTIIYSGRCNDTSNLNIILHLLLNLLATVVLASSNFFMQVVASPSREEINVAHASFLSLDIGVLSTKNLRHISYFKGLSWAVLVISSLPIHLFLNSSIFETNYQGSDWHLTVATEAFTKGGDFFPPGASLTPAGSSYPSDTYICYQNLCGYYRSDKFYESGQLLVDGYGDAVPLDLYENKASSVEQNIIRAATSSSNWVELDINTCRIEYALCKPRSQYRDVVLVVESGADDPRGWRREEVFNLTQNASLQWDKYVPQGNINTLWYSTQCKVWRTLQFNDDSCEQSCGGVFGNGDGLQVPASRDFPTDWEFTLQSSSNITLVKSDANFKYNDAFWNLTVKHCLAEPYISDCKIGVSNILLMVVIICISAKVIQCSVVLWKLPRTSLVTLGDAVESFIRNPDFRTVGLGTLDIMDIHHLETRPRHHWLPGDETLTSKIKPRRWLPANRRYMSIIPRTVWARTYGLLLVSLAVTTIFFESCYKSNHSSFKGSFGYSDNVRVTDLEIGYMAQLIVANIPQILLSLSYFSYNSFFTRLLAEQEWNSYSQKFQPLRVSHPIGKQISSYRLQLPYKYSIPLLSISVLCHWLLSNAFFLFVMTGGYGTRNLHADTASLSYFHVPDDSLISLGYSPPAILTLFIVVCLLIPLPFLFSLRKLQNKMVAGASNSLVISAACHCRVPPSLNNDTDMKGSNHVEVKRSRVDNHEQEVIWTDHVESGNGSILLQDLVGCDRDPGQGSLPDDHSQADLVRSNGDAGGVRSLEEDNSTPMAEDLEQWEEKLRIVSQSELRWGAMPLPSYLAEAMDDVRRETVMHLGFGDESCNIRSPGEGEWCV